jgi:hypothetical protein
VKRSRKIHGVKLTFAAAYESIGARWSSLLISNASLKFAMTFFEIRKTHYGNTK